MPPPPPPQPPANVLAARVPDDGGLPKAPCDTRKTGACAGCGADGAAQVCAGCLARYYCSRQCQTTHWKEEHRSECSVLGLSTVQTRQLELFGMVVNGDLRGAEESFQRLMPFAERVCQPGLDMHIQTLAGLIFDWANLLGRINKLHEADEQFVRGEKMLEGCSKLHFLSLLCHGRAMRTSVLRKLGRHVEALSLLEDTIMWLRELMRVSPEVVQTLRLSLNERTLLLTSLGRYEEAEAAVRESLALFLPGLPPDAPVMMIAAYDIPLDAHHDVGSALSFLAELRRLQGNSHEALVLIAKALQLAERNQGAINPLVASSLRQLARGAQGGSGLDDQLRLYDSALNVLRENSKGEPTATLCVILLARGILLDRAGIEEEACICLAEAVQVGEEVESRSGPHPHLAEALSSLGQLEVRRGQLEAAAGLFEQAWASLKRSHGPDCSTYPLDRLEWMSQYAPTLWALGRVEEASMVEARLQPLREREEAVLRQALTEAKEAVSSLDPGAAAQPGWLEAHGESKATGDAACGVCEKDLRVQPAAAMECGHVLHMGCLAVWQHVVQRRLQSPVSRCPMCRESSLPSLKAQRPQPE